MNGLSDPSTERDIGEPRQQNEQTFNHRVERIEMKEPSSPDATIEGSRLKREEEQLPHQQGGCEPI